MTGSLFDELEIFGRATVVTFHRPLIPFLKEPWSSRSKYPAILLETFLYGVYVVLFAWCAFVLIRRKMVQRTLLVATSLLFLLATADIIITGYFFFHFVLKPAAASTPSTTSTHETWNRLLEIKFGFYVVANAIASSLLISRCYEVWQNKRIVITPILLLICGTVISFVSISANQLGDRLLAASFITSAAANLSVTLLIATRMWWTSRKIRGIFNMDFSSMCDYIVSLILDSGAIYSLSIFLYLVFHTLVLDASLTQIAGVTLTAMTLRKASSEALGDTTTFSSTSTLPEIRPDAVARTPSLPRSGLRTSFLTIRPQRNNTVGTEIEYK
ncbi:hypothetical protein GALMADRAFT_893033 [Galerina marginata CBS 339.88]|uniref:Uncharacterized protein n=1 Tax=Galerina marginata (strain CBS 339.88) TaxID=685588 RepID=A0A067SH46_GALM3|nr:hypothetical protein GALMADRAFT_893033 [Galerina marginata CBS 339.88]